MIKEKRIVIENLFEEVWNKQNVEALDLIFKNNAKIYLPTGEIIYPEDFKPIVKSFFSSFPDIKHTIDDLLVDNEKVAVRWQGKGTHQGSIGDIPPTGKLFCYSGISIFYIPENMITKAWVYNNFSDALVSLQSH